MRPLCPWQIAIKRLRCTSSPSCRLSRALKLGHLEETFKPGSCWGLTALASAAVASSLSVPSIASPTPQSEAPMPVPSPLLRASSCRSSSAGNNFQLVTFSKAYYQEHFLLGICHTSQVPNSCPHPPFCPWHLASLPQELMHGSSPLLVQHPRRLKVV